MLIFNSYPLAHVLIFAFIFYELMGWKVTRDNMPGPWWKLNFESQLDEGFLSTWRADRVCKIITDETCTATFDALAPARWVTETSALWPGWARCSAASAPSSGCSSSPCPSPSSATASPSSTRGRSVGRRTMAPTWRESRRACSHCNLVRRRVFSQPGGSELEMKYNFLSLIGFLFQVIVNSS